MVLLSVQRVSTGAYGKIRDGEIHLYTHLCSKEEIQEMVWRQGQVRPDKGSHLHR